MCPPCHDLKEMSEREMFFFTLLLKEENDFAAGYGRPGTLCLPHLRAKHAEGGVPWKALLRFSGSLGRSAREEAGRPRDQSQEEPLALLRGRPPHGNAT